MNANELAEIADSLVIEIPIREWVDNEPKNVMTDISTMLRQQHAELTQLKNLFLDNQILLDKTLNAWAKEMERKK